jgi:hypothetical protein
LRQLQLLLAHATASTPQYMLGFVEKARAHELLRHQFPSKLGGRPVRDGGCKLCAT